MIGNIITVTVDRPIGTYHPEHPDLYYPINYGYIKGILAPDGEEQDAYILGVSEPLIEFTGEIIAIVHRNNDYSKEFVSMLIIATKRVKSTGAVGLYGK